MASGRDSSKKLNLVWICHFNNSIISSKLGVSNSFEFAPWIWKFIQIFFNHKHLHITVIMPHRKIWLTKKIVLSDTITIIAFPDYRLPFLKKAQRKFNTLFHFPFHAKKIQILVKSIKPDLVHLFGAENPYYSSSALLLYKQFPFLLTIQGIFSSNIHKTGSFAKYREQLENKIFRKISYFGVRDSAMRRYISHRNENALFFHHDIAIKNPNVQKNAHPTNDLVFFARIDKSKGIEDFIETASYLYKKRLISKVAIVGHGEKLYLKALLLRAKKAGVDHIIQWYGALPSIEEVHKVVANAKIVLLPTYNDTIPGTILESIQIGVPIVAYSTGGIPSLNSARESIILAPTGDLNRLKHATEHLIRNDTLRERIVRNAKITYKDRWGDEVLFEQIMEIYYSITRVNKP